MKGVLSCWIMILLFSAAAGQSPQNQSRGEEWVRREEMIKTQLIARGITSARVLEAFQKVPRHRFVPDPYRRYAYADQPLPIGEGQTISQPYIVAYMTEILDIKPGEKVLEIGTGSGYQAAILSEMEALVYSVEINPVLSEMARKALAGTGYENLRLKTGDGYQGWPEHAPYDAVLVTCSPSAIPGPLKEQLAEGGRMIIPVGKQYTIQYLVLLEKKNGKIRQKNVLPVRFVPMVNEKGKNY
ncbi:MAG: Protein-L-isoaspartate O-methyltransferase [Bacteroidetes bacterium ADurb.Bin123]|nr:MAG: Protein-L-isoaspartate O-methyltransferase [Bacteroidetes bacterium ADurb.Bin123]